MVDHANQERSAICGVQILLMLRYLPIGGLIGLAFVFEILVLVIDNDIESY
jgi:hypothetical protein